MKDAIQATPSFNNSVVGLQNNLGQILEELKKIETGLSIFYAQDAKPKNPRVDELEKMLCTENRCDLDRLHKCEIASVILLQRTQEIFGKMVEAFGH